MPQEGSRQFVGEAGQLARGTTSVDCETNAEGRLVALGQFVNFAPERAVPLQIAVGSQAACQYG